VFKIGARSKAAVTEIRAVNAEELHGMLQEAEAAPLLIIFTAAWCGPCKLVMDSIYIALKRFEPGSVRVVKVDVEAEDLLATQLKVGKLPTLMFCGPNQGKPAIRTQGLVSEKLIEDLIRNRSPYAGTDLERSIHW
jgi:thioredoxin-like negative regulator of GroEL